MKIIFSRKGFDSASGGCASPVFPDGSLLSLPIPDATSGIRYGEIAGNHWLSVGDAVLQLAGIPSSHYAHLDPDLSPHSVPRRKKWRPIFGQVGAAESHLRNQGVGPGDIFLFFGLFRPVARTAPGWQYVRNSRSLHAIFGWLQIAERISVSSWPATESWALYHPHFHRAADPTNVVYVATEHLTLPSDECIRMSGAGVFSRLTPAGCLTAPESDRPSRWLLPKWLHPEGRCSSLTYHGDPSRWSKVDNGVLLDSVGRGQEFVLDAGHYPESIPWLVELLTETRTSSSA
jgi:hypothetical protein